MNIEIKNITKAYGDKQIFDRFSLTLRTGEITCIMAPSGRGKTTLARILLGLEKADGGEVQNVPSFKAAVFQEDRLAERLTVSKNIRIACRKASYEDILGHLKAVGLGDAAMQTAGSLSGGQRRRAALVRAVLADAEFIVLDEPFAGLDIDTKAVVTDYLRANLVGKTALLITHEEADAKALNAVLHVI